MKVFEVITEYCGEDKEIIKTIQYVTAKDNSLLSVVDYFTRHCYEYEKDLKSVREVLTITENVRTSSMDEEYKEFYLEDKS